MSKFSLLYVDDEESNLNIFKNTFRRKYNIYTAISAKEGIKILDSHQIDLVLSDQRMPEMTGVQFLKYTLEKHPEPNRILVTGYSDFDAIENAVNSAQIFQYIKKPWDNNQLGKVIDDALKIYNFEKESKKHKEELEKAIDKSEQSESKLQKRVKELNCIFSISEIVEKPQLSLGEILDKIVQVLPASWQYPEVAEAKIFIDEKEYKTKLYKETPWKLRENINTNDKNVGYVEINYSENSTNRNDNIFLEEEKTLLKAVSERIGRIVEQKELEKALQNFIDSQEVIIKLRTNELTSTNRKLNEEIEERRINEKTLSVQKEQLQELNATKNKFFSIISHDLRGPLGTNMEITSLFLEKHNSFSHEKKEKFINALHENNVKIYNLLDNLLKWANSQSGNMNYNPIKFNLLNLVNNSLHFTEIALNNKEITIENKVNDQISVHVDENMISTVFRNIISNAIKFTPRKGVIEINAKTGSNGTIEICISDTGLGLSKKNLERLFKIEDTFSNPGTDNEKGSGLGLIICKEFVEKNEGKIWVESEEGKGSKFYFTLKKSVS